MFYFLRKVVAVVVVALMGFGGYSLYNEFGGKYNLVPAVMISDIQNLQELATVRCDYNTYVKYEKERPKIPVMGWNVPGTKSMAAFNVVGHIKVGINMEKMELTQEGRTLYVKIPKAELFSHELDLSKCQVLYEDTSIFNLPNAEDYLAYIRTQKERIGQEALTEAVMASANERAKKVISQRIHQINQNLEVTFVG